MKYNVPDKILYVHGFESTGKQCFLVNKHK